MFPRVSCCKKRFPRVCNRRPVETFPSAENGKGFHGSGVETRGNLLARKKVSTGNRINSTGSKNAAVTHFELNPRPVETFFAARKRFPREWDSIPLSPTAVRGQNVSTGLQSGTRGNLFSQQETRGNLFSAIGKIPFRHSPFSFVPFSLLSHGKGFHGSASRWTQDVKKTMFSVNYIFKICF